MRTTMGKTLAETLEEIADKVEEMSGPAPVAEIRETLKWRKELFEREEIQQILSKIDLDLSTPKNAEDLLRFGKNLFLRGGSEAKRLYDLMNAVQKPVSEQNNNLNKKPGHGGPGR